MKTLLRITILIMGFSGIVAQMLLLRELLIVFSGNELSIGIILANWLILEAFGCFFLGKKAETVKNKIATFAGITILLSLSLPIAVYLTRILKVIMGISIGESIGFTTMLYSSFLILLPTSILHGALFPFCCKLYSDLFARDATSIGKVYVYETLGTIIGGILWTYLFISYLHAFQIAIALSILNFILLIALLAYYWKPDIFQRTVTYISVLLLIFSVSLFLTGGVDKLQQLSIKAQWKGHNIIHYQNSIYGNICVVKSEGQYIFFSDGIPNIIVPIPDIWFVEKFVNLPLLAHPDPKRLLILSGGAGGVIDEILKHPSVELIEYAELDPLFLELIRKYTTPLTESELTNEKVRVRQIDGRLFLKTTPDKYDLILVGLSNPSDIQTNRFFTKEFFFLAEKRLNKEGIIVIGLPSSLSYINDELKNLNGSIYHTLKDVFTYVRVFPGDGMNLFLASNSEEITLFDSKRLINRINEREIKVEVPIARHIEEQLHPGWQDWFSMFIEGSSNKINHDFKPLGVFYSISHWNALHAPYLKDFFRYFEKMNLTLFFVLFIFFVVLSQLLKTFKKRFFGSGIPFTIMTTGIAGMIFDLGLIFTFQSIYGYVFFWIGLLVTSFMVGLAIGGMLMTSLLTRITKHRRLFIKVDLMIICFSLLLPSIFFVLNPYLDSPGSFFLLKILFLTLSLISGFLIGAQFPLANKLYLEYNKNISKTAGTLYAADLIGGWIGGVFGGVILLPVMGLFGSFIIIVLLKLWSFIIFNQSYTTLLPKVRGG